MKAILLVLLLCGCAQPPAISTSPLGGIPADSMIAVGLKDAAFNLDSAVAIGVLPADDPAASCIHGVMKDAGLEGNAPGTQSFTPRVSDIISAGSVAYIEAQKLKALGGGAKAVPVGCDALVGRIVIDAARLGARGASSTLLPLPIRLP